MYSGLALPYYPLGERERGREREREGGDREVKRVTVEKGDLRRRVKMDTL